MVNMDYEIIETTVGPITKWKDQLVTLQDIPVLLDIAYANPNFLNDLYKAIQQGMASAFKDQLDAFEMKMNFHSPKINAYISSATQYISFISGPWPQYRQVMENK